MHRSAGHPVRRLDEGHESTPARVAEWIRGNRDEWRTGGPRRHFGVYAGTDARLVGGVEASAADRAVVRVAPGNVHSRRVPAAAGFTEIGLVEDHEGCFVRYERVLRS